LIRRVVAAAAAVAAFIGALAAPVAADGWVVDAHGGLHPFGGAPVVAGSGWWPDEDLARGVVLDDMGEGGWVLDAWGGLHPFGGAAPVAGEAWWPGEDRARGAVVDDGGPGGWVVAADGSMTTFGGAAPVQVTAWWPGEDLARGLVLDDAGFGGWVVDAFGGLHPFGDAEPVSGSGWWPGEDRVRGAVADDGGPGGWVVAADGSLHEFGGAPAVEASATWSGRDLARAVVADDDGPGGWVVDAHGGLHPFGGAPAVSGSGWWPDADLARGATGGSGARGIAGPPVRRTVTYDVRTAGATRSSAEDLAASAAETYLDPRGWRAAGIAFERVVSGGDFTLWLAAPSRMESFSSVCDAFYSCRVGRNVIINDDRFTSGSPYWPGSVDEYRDMVVNHETGHWLGLGHRTCPLAGAPAPVMQQQSKGLGGCTPNPWPTNAELLAVAG
jgi:hypothetical protein